MAISYPLALPGSPAPESAEFYIERNQVAIEGFSRQVQVQKNPGDRWIGKITLPVMTAAQAADWLGFFDALDGLVGSFTMRHPDYQSALGNVGTDTGLVRGAGQQGTTLLTDGWAASTTDLFKRGDMIQVGDKLKRVTANATSDASGIATLELAPAFYSSPADNAVITPVNPTGIFRLSEGFVVPQSDSLRNHRFSFAFEEVLS